MYYSEEIIADVRQKNDIVDVISQYVALQKKGSNYMCCCPFHQEKTPSFSVSRSKQMYKCFGCGKGGNVFTFLQEYENITFPEAMQNLARRAGVALPKAEQSDEAKKKEAKRLRILEVNKEAASFYYLCLRDPRGRIGYDYFKKRELQDETLKAFGLGFAPPTGDDMIRYLKGKGFSDRDLMDSGLASFKETEGMRSYFWNRVMFPIMDANNRVIGFGGRVMGKGEPKYLNSPETDVFDKSRNLYGLNLAKKSRAGYFILCEGYMDVIALHQAGFNMAVASLGTSFTPGQAFIIKRYVPDVYISYDSDGAGIKAAMRAIGILRNHGISPKIINMQPYKDPDEFIKGLGKEEYQKRIEEAENFFLFQVRITEQKYNMEDPDGKTRFYRDVSEQLCGFEEELERENYIQAVCGKYNIKAEDLKSMVAKSSVRSGGKTIPDRPLSGIHDKSKREEGKYQDEQILLTFLADVPGLYGKVKKYVSAEDFRAGPHYEAAQRFFEEMDTGRKPDLATLICLSDDAQEQSRISSLFNTYLEGVNTKEEKEKAFHDVLLSVKTRSCQIYMSQSGSDLAAMGKSIAAKKELQELEKMKFTIDGTDNG